MSVHNSVTWVCNSVTSSRNIIQFQAMSLFCYHIKGMFRSKVTDNSYIICRPSSEHLQINPCGFLRITRLCTNLWEWFVYVLIFENNPYWFRFLRKIRILRKFCTYTGTDFWIWKTQKWWNFHGMVQFYRLMLHIAVTLYSYFLHLVTLSRTALVTQRGYITALYYSVTLHVCTYLYVLLKRKEKKQFVYFLNEHF